MYAASCPDACSADCLPGIHRPVAGDLEEQLALWQARGIRNYDFAFGFGSEWGDAGISWVVEADPNAQVDATFDPVLHYVRFVRMDVTTWVDDAYWYRTEHLVRR